MTVQELITALEGYPRDALVFIYEPEVDIVSHPTSVESSVDAPPDGEIFIYVNRPDVDCSREWAEE